MLTPEVIAVIKLTVPVLAELSIRDPRNADTHVDPVEQGVRDARAISRDLVRQA